MKTRTPSLQIPSAPSSALALSLLGALALFSCLISQLQAQTIVTTTTDENESPPGGNISLREAINSASAGESITFDPAVFTGGGQNQIILTMGQLLIDKDLTIDASALSETITINANGASRILEIDGATVALHGLTLTGGAAEAARSAFPQNAGGAIYNDQATLSLTNCTLTGNTAGTGGGIYSNGEDGSATLSLTDCALTDNSATDNTSTYESDDGSGYGNGGAIYANGETGSVTVSLSSCTLSNNFANDGGGAIYSTGIYSGNSSLSLSQCTISGNTGNFGGGLFSSGIVGNAELIMSACTLSHNVSDQNGGAIASNGENGVATANLNACTLVGNSAREGGGIFNTGDSGSALLDLSSCTVTDNFALSGGGVCCAGTTGGSANLNLNNTILAGNNAPGTGPDLREISGSDTTASGINLMSSAAGHGTIGGSGTVTILSTPLALAPLGHYGGPTQTMPPLPGSPALDAAGSDDPGGTDQRGFPRFFNGALDIGAVEFQGEAAELDLAFEEDLDGDGTSVGVELAIGTDPLLADPEHPNKLRLASFDEVGLPLFTFGIAGGEQANITLRLMRSIDLITFDDEVISNEFGDFPLTILDLDPPAGEKAFYRLEAEVRQ